MEKLDEWISTSEESFPISDVRWLNIIFIYPENQYTVNNQYFIHSLKLN